jgi:hypothetical protein
MDQGSFVTGLIASGPAIEHRDALMLYGQFVGDWVTETTEWLFDGSSRTSQWDVRFQWVLEGRAIQDLWITPPRSEKPIGWTAEGNRYSTTLRIYDPAIDAWHIVWINPPSATVIRQLGRRVGDEIVQIGPVDAAGAMSRWVYRDVMPTTFRWCNERSADNGMSWQLIQEMRATRIHRPPS